ncbi:hypothetical protein [Dyadobacter sp. SG02]|uniref:hypothetical protein n=1 Tax=Dyadobacter sp. SG02 TaxID=1855291 RepID=UPI000B85D3EE|nr:hypothetical protein [Dyadobacter sp. SG02]
MNVQMNFAQQLKMITKSNFLKKIEPFCGIKIAILTLFVFWDTPTFAQKNIDTTARWEIGYDIMPNLRSISTGKMSASFIVKRYGQSGLNAWRFKLLFFGNNIGKQETEGLIDSSGYVDSHRSIWEGRVGREWGRTILSGRAKIFWGSDIVYSLTHESAEAFTNAGDSKWDRSTNTFSYGISPLLGLSYAFKKGLAISVETHLNLYPTFTRRRVNDPTLAPNTVTFRQNGFDYQLNAVDMLYISLRF